MRKLLTVKDLCELFQKYENRIYRWITEDRLFLNAFRVKDGWYVPKRDIYRLMREGLAYADDSRSFGNIPGADVEGQAPTEAKQGDTEENAIKEGGETSCRTLKPHSSETP